MFDALKNTLSTSGPIPFVDFMQAALYDPLDGYYTQGLPHFGEDFVTAPELSCLFGFTLANHCAPWMKRLAHPVIFEFGAGSGRLCVDVLRRLEQWDALPEQYCILDLSGGLIAQQKAFIHEEIPHLASKIHWLNRLPDLPFEGVVLANEVLDAMPVHRFLQTEQGLLEYYVDFNKQWIELTKPCDNPKLQAHVAHVLPSGWYGYQSEANLYMDEWMLSLSAMIKKGMVVLIDYGYPRHEYYHKDRHQGTLMCHHKHKTHPNPYIHVGQQDITAHVDFTHVAEAAQAAGFDVAGYTNQAGFLLANGLLDLIRDDHKHQDHQAIKLLTHPQDMGELFKVMVLTKHLEWERFPWQDKRASL